MRKDFVIFAAAAAGTLGLSAAMSACSADDTPAAPVADASPEADTAFDGGFLDEFVPSEDAAAESCTLNSGGDPVALCTQKLVLRGMHEGAFLATTGVLAGWDSTSGVPDQDDAGAPRHDVRDDAAYAAAISAYGTNATTYGDTELTPTTDKDLVNLIPILKKGMSPIPNDYSGELYAHLRGAAVGLQYVSANDDADAIDALADAYARGIDAHFVSLGVSDGVLAVDAVTKDYSPADVATGALALLDMATRHAPLDGGAGDSGASTAEVAGWIQHAQESLEHIYANARHAPTGMYYRLVVAGTESISPRAPLPADELTSDASGTIALALYRAADLVDANPSILGSLATFPFRARAGAAIASVNGGLPVAPNDGGAPDADAPDADLADGAITDADTGDAASTDAAADGGGFRSLWDDVANGYMEGWVPSTATLITSKPTRSNALLFAAIHRQNVAAVSPFASQLKPLRGVVTSRAATNVSLLSAGGAQEAYFTAVSVDFHLLPASPSLPHPASYSSAATTIACEGLDEQWVGVPH